LDISTSLTATDRVQTQRMQAAILCYAFSRQRHIGTRRHTPEIGSRNMTKYTVRMPLFLVASLAIGLLSGCEKEKGACIATFDKSEECRTETTRELCTAYAEPGVGSPKTTRFVAVTKEDRDRFENVKAIGGDVTGLVCRRLGYLDCRMGTCRRK
jgi:hypothetical protein